MTPRRIQRKRTRGWRMPPGAIYVGRPTRWGNPFTMKRVENGLCWRWHTDGPIWHVSGYWDHKDLAQQHIADYYREWLLMDANLVADVRRELRGRDLACWCPLDQPCHADVLLEIANQEAQR